MIEARFINKLGEQWVDLYEYEEEEGELVSSVLIGSLYGMVEILEIVEATGTFSLRMTNGREIYAAMLVNKIRKM